jgi:hypothetical protein
MLPRHVLQQGVPEEGLEAAQARLRAPSSAGPVGAPILNSHLQALVHRQRDTTRRSLRCDVSGRVCNVCGSTDKSKLKEAPCCGEWLCSSKQDYVHMSYSRAICSRCRLRCAQCGDHKNCGCNACTHVAVKTVALVPWQWQLPGVGCAAVKRVLCASKRSASWNHRLYGRV